MALDHSPIRPVRNLLGERVYARKWAELMSAGAEDDKCLLDTIMRECWQKCDQRDARVAASLVAWLGTTNGMAMLKEANRIGERLGDQEAGLAAAWAIMNKRRSWSSNGWRTMEFIVATEEEVAKRVRPQMTTADVEVLEQVVLWLASEEGSRFVEQCEKEIDTGKKLEALEQFARSGQSDLPRAQEIRAELMALGALTVGQ